MLLMNFMKVMEGVRMINAGQHISLALRLSEAWRVSEDTELCESETH